MITLTDGGYEMKNSKAILVHPGLMEIREADYVHASRIAGMPLH